RTAPDNGQAPNLPPEEAIHPKAGPALLQKVTRRRPWYPWLDAVGRPVQPAAGPRGRPARPSRLQASELDGARQVTAFYLERLVRSEEHTSELQSREKLVCRLLLEITNKH